LLIDDLDIVRACETIAWTISATYVNKLRLSAPRSRILLHYQQLVVGKTTRDIKSRLRCLVAKVKTDDLLSRECCCWRTIDIKLTNIKKTESDS